MKMFVIMSHVLTEDQVKQIYKLFSIKTIVYLPENLKKIWMEIPAEGKWKKEWIKDITFWLSDQLEIGDKVIVQGEPGACFFLVAWLQQKGIEVYYATTERNIVEQKNEDGSVILKRIFKHVTFRQYPCIKEIS
ncbi:MAG: hypothetical protein C6W57_08900 [Caldibacillus debilis]|uniref:CRISPR-associated protein Csx20 n=1 Tax=Caldibacillus debilis TaxID=301148 RepID=UPI000E393A90|nr:CRISPR-associated protein Csx20 [Caldibacillus debilis]REJ16216.1 MAG: hypothetical protein C6W57_08900 [Caldibacillus debilis]